MAIQPFLITDDLNREGLFYAFEGTNFGVFDFATDEDYFLFAPEPNHFYRIIVDSNVDAELGVYNVTFDELLSEDDDGGPGHDPEINFVAPQIPTSLILQVDAVGNGEPGDLDPTPIFGHYNLIILDLGLVEEIPPRIPGVDLIGNTFGTASGIGINQVVEEAIETPGDLDAFTVFLERGREYRISLVDDNTGFDAFLELYNSQGQAILQSNDIVGSTDAVIEFTPDFTDFFFVTVTDFDLEFGTGNYQLFVQDRGPDLLPLTGDQIGNVVQEAGIAEVDIGISTRVDEVDVGAPPDVDVFEYVLVGGNTYQVDVLRGLDGLDPVVAVLDRDGNILLGDNDSGQGTNARITNIVPTETDIFFVAVGGREGITTGDYEVLVSLVEGQEVTTLEAQDVALLYEAGLNRDGDIDLPGLDFWIEAFQGDPVNNIPGLSIEAIAQFFLDSDEFALVNGDPAFLTNFELVTQFYLNVLDRPEEEIDDEGRDFWVGVFDRDPGYTRARLLVDFARSQENADNLAFVDDLRPAGDFLDENFQPGQDGDVDWDFIPDQILV